MIKKRGLWHSVPHVPEPSAEIRTSLAVYKTPAPTAEVFLTRIDDGAGTEELVFGAQVVLRDLLAENRSSRKAS